MTRNFVLVTFDQHLWWFATFKNIGIIYISAHCLICRVFTNGPGDLGSVPGRFIPKSLKMVLDTSLLNTQQCKVCIKGKVEQSREGSLFYCYYTSVLSVQIVWKLATLVEGDPKAPFSIATTPKCREGRFSIFWIAPLYPWILTL